MKIDQQTWARVFPWLDKAQDVSATDRPRWIAQLVAEQPEVGIPLRDVMAKTGLLDDEEFLELTVQVPANRPLRTGQQVGAYTIDTLLAEGGMAEVWLAHRSDGQFEGKFAVKLLHFDVPGAKALERFKREGSVLAQLTHPNIARLIDAGAIPNAQPFLILEYIDGEHIDKYCESHALSTRSRVRLFMNVLAAVAHAHTNLIIHRDIKPSNVLVAAEGSVKLLDFGIAKLVDCDASIEKRGQLTQAEEIALTPMYAAPEQLLSEPLSTATDVYQLGILLHVLLTGRMPRRMDASTGPDRLKAALHETSVRMSEAVSGPLRTELQGDLDAIVEKSLRNRPLERYSTAAALSADLQHYLEHEPVSARAGLFAYRTGKFVRRYRSVVVSVTATIGCLLIATVISVSQEHKIRIERDRADEITSFMTQIFKLPDPGEARGNTVTAREILDRSSKQIETGNGIDAGVQSDLLKVMADTYSNLGLYARAHNLAKEALNSRRRLLGPENAKTLESLQQVGEILFLEGHVTEAEETVRQVISVESRFLGSSDARHMEARATLIDILLSEGRYADGEKLGRQLLAQEVGRSRPNSLLALKTMNLLASAFRHQSKFAEAEALFRQTATLEQKILGVDHPNTLKTQFLLANTLQVQGRYADAEVIHREVLAAQQRVLGDDHPETADTMSTLAMDMAYDPSRYADAEQLLRKALDIEMRTAGPESRFTTRAEDALADVLDDEKRYSEAELLFREVLRTREKVLGPDNADTLLAQYNLIVVLNDETHYEEAERLARATLASQTRVLNSDDPDTLLTKIILGDILIKTHHPKEAEPFARESFEVLQRKLGPQHTQTLGALFWYARALSGQGRYDEATNLYSNIIKRIAQLPTSTGLSGVWHDFACVAALAGRNDDAVQALANAQSNSSQKEAGKAPYQHLRFVKSVHDMQSNGCSSERQF